jgi:hypothetical protein
LKKSYRKILLYIIYGEDQGYYDGAKFSYLTFMNWVSEKDNIETVILTQKPEEFDNLPATIISISEKQKKDWSLDGKYHFRIKNRGLSYVMSKLNLINEDKILFFDTDTYFHKSPLPLFDLIQPGQALFYLNEGRINHRKRFKVYVENLDEKKIIVDSQNYELTENSRMWGSLMVGIMPNMKPSLDWADKLMLELINIVPAHTIEPFSLSEALLRKYKIVEGKDYVSLYSTSRKKIHATEILSKFFEDYSDIRLEDKIKLAQKVKIKRSFIKVLKQRFLQIINHDK